MINRKRTAKSRGLWMLAFGSLALAGGALAEPAAGQLQTLSQGNTDQQWRDAQLQVFDLQLADSTLPAELRLELEAQRKWLAAWNPKLPTTAPGEATAAAASTEARSGDSLPGRSDDRNRLREPILDPENLAAELRARLFESKDRPTSKDTAALQTALMEHPDDLGLRQLQLHWIDQPRYRDDYWKAISEASGRVAALIGQLPASEESKITAEDSKTAAAFAHYRRARALAHCLRGRPLDKSTIAGAEKLSTAERQQMQNTIGECSRQIETLVGAGRSEFFQLEVYVLQRDGWNGRALELLDRYATRVDQRSYLQARKELLESLGWTKPSAQVAAQLAVGAPRSRSQQLLEIQFVPLDSE